MGRPTRRQHIAVNVNDSRIPGAVWGDGVEARREDKVGHCNCGDVVAERDVAIPMTLLGQYARIRYIRYCTIAHIQWQSSVGPAIRFYAPTTLTRRGVTVSRLLHGKTGMRIMWLKTYA